jgi:predicted GTPase
MTHGAGWIAAVGAGAGEIIDPRTCAQGSFGELYRRYPHIGRVLPATGYSARERLDLAATIEAAGADVVVAGTPIDLQRVLELRTPVIRAVYEHREVPGFGIWPAIEGFLCGLARADD